MRIVRAGVGVLLLLVAVPLVIAGGGLWVLAEHRGVDGTFSAGLQRLRLDTRAAVVTDVDAMLRAEAPFARGGRTTFSLAARGPGGPLFLGLADYGDIERYLAGVTQTRLTRVRLARGALPVDAISLPGELAPKGPPTAQTFWLATSTGLIRDGRVEDALAWSPSSMRGRHLGLVVMNADGSAGLDVTLRARLAPAWLAPTSTGLLILGTAMLLLALLTLAWPQARHDPILAAVPDELALPPMPAVALRFTWPPIALPAVPPVIGDRDDRVDVPV